MVKAEKEIKVEKKIYRGGGVCFERFLNRNDTNGQHRETSREEEINVIREIREN